MIRLPDIPNLSPQPIDAPAMRTGAAAAPAAALGQLAESIASVSDQFHDHAIKLQRIDNARILSEKRRALADSYATFQNDLAADPDPTSRIDKTRSFFATARDQLTTGELPPETQAALEDHFENFATQAVIRQAEDSLRLGVQRGRMALQNDLDAAIRAGDPAMAAASLAEHEAAGTIMPEERIKFETATRRQLEMQRINEVIEAEPTLILDNIKGDTFPSEYLTPEDVQRVKAAAEDSVQRKRSEELDTIEAALITGQLHPRDLEAAQYLTPKDRAKIQHSMQLRETPDTSAHSKAWDGLFKLREAFNNPAISDAKYAELWNTTRTETLALLPRGYQGDIAQELSYRSTANRTNTRTATTRPPAADAADKRSLATERIKKAYNAGLFGSIDDPKSKTAQAALTRFEDVRLSIWDFIRKNPDAPQEAIRAQIGTAIASSLSDGKPLIPVPAAPMLTNYDARADELLGLPPLPTTDVPDNLPAVLPPP